MAHPPRLVLDTNVCLDLFVFGDASCATLREALRAGAVQAVTDAACRAEWRRVLAYPQLGLDAARREAAVAAFDAQLHLLLPSPQRKLGSSDSSGIAGSETEHPGFTRAPVVESLSPRERVATCRRGSACGTAKPAPGGVSAMDGANPAGRGFGQGEALQPARTLTPDPSPGGRGEKAASDAPRAAMHYCRSNGAVIDAAQPAAPGLSKLPRCADPDDQQFLELAQACGAQWLLSRDNELLKLARRTRRDHGFDILTPQAWAQIYSAAGDSSLKPV